MRRGDDMISGHTHTRSQWMANDVDDDVDCSSDDDEDVNGLGERE